MTEKAKKYLIRAVDCVSWTVIVCAGLVLLYAGCRVFVCDQFVIPSLSMSPTLIPGDRILADKLTFGARIYTSYDFAEHQPLKSWRMPGFRKIRPNDVLVFNMPNGYAWDKIEFKINYVFSKRCIGTPGDSVRIERGFYKNNRYDKPIGLESEQQRMISTPDSLIPDCILKTLPFDGRWTAKEFGPLYVPARGDTMRLTAALFPIYKAVIEYETGGKLTLANDGILLDNAYIADYTFQNDYYFVGGDNVMDSGDSRYWGFVPEEFIIGIAKRISYSRNRDTEKFRWDRFWRKIDKQR